MILGQLRMGARQAKNAPLFIRTQITMGTSVMATIIQNQIDLQQKGDL